MPLSKRAGDALTQWNQAMTGIQEQFRSLRHLIEQQDYQIQDLEANLKTAYYDADDLREKANRVEGLEQEIERLNGELNDIAYNPEPAPEPPKQTLKPSKSWDDFKIKMKEPSVFDGAGVYNHHHGQYDFADLRPVNDRLDALEYNTAMARNAFVMQPPPAYVPNIARATPTREEIETAIEDAADGFIPTVDIVMEENPF